MYLQVMGTSKKFINILTHLKTEAPMPSAKEITLIIYKDMSYLSSLNVLISLPLNIAVVKYADPVAWKRTGRRLMQMKIVTCCGNLCIIVMAVLCQSVDFILPPPAMAIANS